MTSPLLRFQDYGRRLAAALEGADWAAIEALGAALFDCLRHGRQVFLCGNGGSAGNALHIVNDWAYGIAKKRGPALRAHALPANVSLLTALANDEGYPSIFAEQLATFANSRDLLVVLSGSGNSSNILEALRRARKMGLRSFAILGYDGGQAKSLADRAIHFPVDDMQISEDLQLVVGHMLMQWLYDVGFEDSVSAENG